jgi:alpha-1,2-mannosyltransferase
MAILTTAILVLLIAATTAFLLPQLIGSVVGLVLRGAGWLIRRRTRSRREYVIARARSDEEELLKTLRATNLTHSLARSSAEDEDWEKVDDTAGSGGVKTSSSSDSGVGDGAKRPDDWNGIIGFFHPFW